MKYVILIPTYNDWDCLNLLIPKIDQVISKTEYEVSILLVNDGSTKKNNLFFKNNLSIKRVEILNLQNNVKAQIAIASGLSHLKKEKFDGGVIVMDADGQDDPENLIPIFQESIKKPKTTITVNRNKREDEFLFKTFYQIYLYLTFFLTFKYLKFGVFTYIHSSSIEKLLSTEDVYLAYVGGIAKHFKNKKIIYAARKKRISGTSQNNYKSLIYYALKIISVFRYQALINTTTLIIVAIFFSNLIVFKIIFLSFLLILNLILFLIPYKIDRTLIKNPLSNVKNTENISN